MATNRAMLKEAIADAKSVKETAIANAKLALEEAFTPQLKSMFTMKLQEMEDMDEMEDKDMYEMEDKDAMNEEEDGMMEVDLEELLAELNEEDEMEESLNEAEEEDDMEMSDEESEEEEGEPIDLEDMTDEDLKSMIEDVIKGMVESGELEAGHEEGEEEEGEEEMEDEEEVDLAELLKEIEDMDEEKESMYESEEELEELFGMGNKSKRNYKTVIDQLVADNDDVIKSIAAETDPAKKKSIADPLLRKAFVEFGKLQRENPAEKVIDNMNEFKRVIMGDSRSLLQKLATGTGAQVAAREGVEEDLNEAYSTIETLKSELNEINLLNAKLLYTNKIFKSKNLNESQKVKVLTSFDKAKNVGEVKMVFETLNEGIKVAKNPIKENLGSASKGTMAPITKKPIVESNDAFLRMQKLAGLI